MSQDAAGLGTEAFRFVSDQAQGFAAPTLQKESAATLAARAASCGCGCGCSGTGGAGGGGGQARAQVAQPATQA